jgi:aspartokinase/homoserine dehydrogenase 1
MKVLKFGGSSVATAENINRVVAIIKERINNDKIVVVVSAMGGITDMLIQCGILASAADEYYKIKLQEIEHRHLETVKLLIPVSQQSSILSWVKKR